MTVFRQVFFRQSERDHSFLCNIVLMRINMTEHLIPHVIAQSVFQLRKDINKTAWK